MARRDSKKYNKYNVKKRGFTLIELLAVLSIIGLLSTIVLAALNTARFKAEDARRQSEMKSLQAALELYNVDNKAYPSTGGSWYGVSVNGGSRSTSGAGGYIPGLAPTYISILPIDPRGDKTGWSGYLYQSNGTEYKLISHENGPRSFPSASSPFYDPVRPTWAWKLCNGNTACNSW
jgi:prepilin-type N-terminal cleavage/methylation domain-containing protein